MAALVKNNVNMVGLSKIQDTEYEVLKELLRIFNLKDLKYYITGGTVLGSVHYKDFIPYDDDIDIAMPRDMYNLFLKVASEELNPQFRLRHFSKDKSFKYSIIRVENINVDIYEVNDPSKKISHPSIDIAPLDGVPNNVFERNLFFLRLLFLRGLLSWYYADSINENKSRKLISRLFIILLKATRGLSKYIDPVKIKRKIDKILTENPMEKSDRAGTYMGAYRNREMLPIEVWGKGRNDYRFRDVLLSGPEDSDLYVKKLYGEFRVYDNTEALRARHYQIIERKDGEKLDD